MRGSAGLTGAPWANGDFNYDGVIDYRDYAIIDAAFASQSGPLADARVAAEARRRFGPAFVTAFAVAVPEPGTVVLLAVGAVGLLRRRRWVGVSPE